MIRIGIDFCLRWVYNGYIRIDRVKTGESPFLLYFWKNMKKNIKKQKNRKNAKSSKTRTKALVKARKSVSKKAPTSKNKAKKSVKIKTKASLKNVRKAVLRKKISKRNKKQENYIITFGNFEPQHGKIAMLVAAIIFVFSFLIVQNMRTPKEEYKQPQVAGAASDRNIKAEKKINDLVQGYPIEKMTRYIAKQDPKVAAFLVAIAKKESAWGERKPVLDGEDCYNYWGFRLKSDRMGSGGHTCFDSPEEAVEIVGSRINHLVNEEKIDTPREMVIWKCGYDCNGPEAVGSQKWIKDVDYYYRQLIN